MRWLQQCLQLKVTADSGPASGSVLQHSIINHDMLPQTSLCLLNSVVWSHSAAHGALHIGHAPHAQQDAAHSVCSSCCAAAPT